MNANDGAAGLRPLFEEPPEGVDSDWVHGALLVSLGSITVFERIEIARAFRAAADRLLDTVLDTRESWEALYPILYCYRHTAELYFKAILPDAPFNHGLEGLACDLKRHISGRYREEHVEQLLARILELHRIDPSSTVFRYADGATRAYSRSGVSTPDPELWVDFHHLQGAMGQVFDALESIWLSHP